MESQRKAYGGLAAAGMFMLVVCVIAGVVERFSGLLDFAKAQTGGLELLIGLGVIAGGVIINGLLRLAINVANDLVWLRIEMANQVAPLTPKGGAESEKPYGAAPPARPPAKPLFGAGDPEALV